MLSGDPMSSGPPPYGSSRPVAVDDVIDTDEGNAVSVPVEANDNSSAGFGSGQVTVVGQPQHGSASQDSEGSIRYNPTAGFYGTDTFTYKFQDSTGNFSNVATATVIVNRPTAVDDTAVTAPGRSVVINVAANDTDPDGNNRLAPGTVAIASQPAHGSVGVVGGGSVSYTPAPGFTGTDRFTYTVQDVASATSNPATVTVTVLGGTGGGGGGGGGGTGGGGTGGGTTNPHEVLNDDLGIVYEGSSTSIPVLSNDTDTSAYVPGSVQVASPPGHGTASVNPADGSVTYTPSAGFGGTDTFTYTAVDAAGFRGRAATVSVVVIRPVANDGFGETFGTTPISLDVLAKDADPGAGQLVPSTVAATVAPQNGSLAVDPSTGAITYTANPGFSGTDRFSYTVKDDHGATSNPATITVVTDLGTVSGVVYRSFSAGATQAAGDPPLAGQLVYIDSNGDGRLEPGEPSTVTNSGGEYTFAGLPAGSYTVREDVAPTSLVVQTAAAAGAFAVTVTPGSHTIVGPQIGNVVESPIAPVTVSPTNFPAPRGVPASTYVQGIYHSVLDQAAGTPTLAAATRQLGKANPAARTALARRVWESAAHREAEVQGDFQTFLGRAPTRAENAAYLRALKAGGEVAMVTKLLSSGAYKAAHPGNADYVASAYSQAVGVAPDAGTVASLSARLGPNGGGRAAVATQILSSTASVDTIIEGLYAGILHAAPDAATLNTLSSKLQRRPGNLEAVAVSLLASDAYYAQAQAASRG